MKAEPTGQALPLGDAAAAQGEKEKGCTSLRGDLRGAYLRGADLRKADLKRVDLAGADLAGADLREADLEEANLRSTTLEGARLDGAVLKRTTLWDANLRNADLTGAKELLPESLAGADLSGAALPECVSQNDGISHANELSKNAGRLLVALLTACAYATVTVFATRDAQLLRLSGAAKLPIVDTEIPLLWFYLLVPTWLLGLYIYFHLYLQRLWEELSRLPAVFSDGRPVDQRIDPWLLNGLARAHFPRLQERRQSLSALQTSLSTVVAWWALPLTLSAFVFRYSSRLLWLGDGADRVWAGLQLLSLVLAVWISLTLRRLGIATLRRETAEPSRSKSPFRQGGTYRRAALALAVVGIAGPLSLLVRSRFPANLQNADLRGVHLEAARLARARLEGAQLDGAHLNNAGLLGAHLEEAHLSESLLSGADLRGADLTGADCRKTHFSGAMLNRFHEDRATLKGTNLTGADLVSAHLQDSELAQAVLTDANLEGAELQNADLQGANLQGADLRQAHLEGAHLEGARLQGADLSTAVGLTASQIQAAFRDAATKLPDYLRAVPLSNLPRPRLIASR